MKTLKQIPVPVAVIIMVLCILVGIAFGNHNALNQAKAEPEAILTEVSALAAQRANSAQNLIVVAERSTVDAKNLSSLKTAMTDLREATRADRIAEANRNVTFAAETVNEQIQLSATDQDKKLATGVMDDLGSQNDIMLRRANAYNESVDSVRSLYNTLPMRWLIGGMPEAYK